MGTTIGAPIVRDHLFVFGAIDPQWETQTLVAPPDFPLASLGNVDRDRRVLNYAVKASYQLNPSHRFNASFFGDPAHGLMGPQRTSSLLRTTTSAFSELNMYGGHNQTVNYEGIITPRFLVEASGGRALNRIQETPSVNEW